MTSSGYSLDELSVTSPRFFNYYHYLKKTFLDQSIYKTFNLIKKTEALMTSSVLLVCPSICDCAVSLVPCVKFQN